MRKPLIHSVKSDRYISFMITTHVGNSGKCFRIPKIIFPFFAILLIGVGFSASFVYMQLNNRIDILLQNNADILAQKEFAESRTSLAEVSISEKDAIIDELLDSIAEKEATLNSLEQQTENIINQLKELEAIRDSIYDKLSILPEDLYNTDEAASKSENDTGTSYSPLYSPLFSPTEYTLSRYAAYMSSEASDVFNKQSDKMSKQLGLLEEMLAENYAAMNILSEMADIYVPYINSIPSGWPVENSKITCNFGYRKDPLTNETAYHGGLDLAAKKKQPIYATASGVVTYAGYSESYGNSIVIDHGNGYSTRYAHCYSLKLKKGSVVSKGDCIALAGNTGRSTAVHLHYEVMIDGKRVNPIDYLN